MAPEIRTGSYDIAVDVWSYGITVAFLLYLSFFCCVDLDEADLHLGQACHKVFTDP